MLAMKPAQMKQYGALPFRRGKAGIEVLLITTRKKKKWSVPKGWPIKAQTAQGTASVEAFEEAGVSGKVSAKQLGRFKNRKVRRGQEVTCDVRLFPLHVHVQRNHWPEKSERRRIWLPPSKAALLVQKPGLKRAIKKLHSQATKKAAVGSHMA
jgi:ADP-ribose pyrophosphatase YjhB (NUDIX family)